MTIQNALNAKRIAYITLNKFNKKCPVEGIFFIDSLEGGLSHLFSYQIPKVFINHKHTKVIDTQQHKPKKIGLAPVLISAIRLQFSPMALIAMMMKNKLIFLAISKYDASTPTFTHTVVIKEASKNNKIKRGIIL